MSLSAKDQVRLLISDVGGDGGSSFLFSDLEIETFLDIVGGDVRIAAATALRTVAGNEVQVAKVIKFLELETNGAAVSKALREQAKELEEQADGDYDFEIIQMNVDLFSRRQLLLQRIERREG